MMKLYRKDMIGRQISKFIQSSLSNDRTLSDSFFHRNNLERSVRIIDIVKVLINQKGTIVDIYYVSSFPREEAVAYVKHVKKSLIKSMYANLNMRRMPYIKFIYDEKYEESLGFIVKNAHIVEDVHETLTEEDKEVSSS